MSQIHFPESALCLPKQNNQANISTLINEFNTSEMQEEMLSRNKFLLQIRWESIDNV